jgi:hypothetical protein
MCQCSGNTVCLKHERVLSLLTIPSFVHNLGKNLQSEALRISKEYASDVITIRLGPIVAIFLNSYDAIRDGLSSDDFMDRPDGIFFKKFICNGKGKME